MSPAQIRGLLTHEIRAGCSWHSACLLRLVQAAHEVRHGAWGRIAPWHASWCARALVSAQQAQQRRRALAQRGLRRGGCLPDGLRVGLQMTPSLGPSGMYSRACHSSMLLQEKPQGDRARGPRTHKSLAAPSDERRQPTASSP